MKNFLIAALSLALLGGCGQAHKESAPAETLEAAPALAAAPPGTVARDEASANEEPEAPTVAPLPTPTAAPRLLVYHAELRIKVESLPRTSARLDSLVRHSGGYLNAATETHQDGEWRQEMTIRVAPGRYATLLAALSHLGTVEEKKQRTDDVTAEHADVTARLRTKRAVEQRYLALLAQAKKISEVLAVESKIAEVREEIESTESRLKTLNDEVAYSTITLTCYQPIAQAVPDAPVVSLGSRIVEAFYGGWSLLTSLLVGVVGGWPLWLLGAGIWWAVRRWRQSRAS